MLYFPTLKTDAVAQYPATRTLSYRADIVSFLDGSEQRFRNAPSALRQWEIALDQLDEQEIAAIQQFFLLNEGSAGTFEFADPFDTNVVYANCSIDADSVDLLYLGPLSSRTRLIIKENRI
jgi:hypothetical protein